MKLLKISILSGILLFSSMVFSQQRKSAFLHKEKSPSGFLAFAQKKKITKVNDSKVQKAIKMRLDSIVSSDDEKVMFTYNDAECIKVQYLIWDEDINEWVEDDVSIYQNGKEIENYYWYINKIGGFRTVYEYNNDELTLETQYDWDAETESWKEDVKYSYMYSYSGDTVERIGKEWDYDENDWTEESEKSISVTDNNGNEILRIDYYWANYANSWMPSDKEEYFYDQHNKDTLHIRSDWSNNQWVVAWMYKQIYTYSDNKVIETISQYYDDNLNVWDNDFKIEYTYDNNYSISNILAPNEYLLYFSGMVTEEKYYEWDEGWEEGSISIYHYSSQNVSIIDISKAEDLKIYPNPTKDILNIQSSSTIEKISFHDISGKEIKTIHQPQSSIMIDYLANGIYFIRIKTDQSESNYKIIKQ